MTNQPVVVLKSTKFIKQMDCDKVYPGAFVISAAMPDHFRGWASSEIYIEEGAAFSHVIEACRSRQTQFKNPVLEVLPEWEIKTRFMSAHQAFLIYENMRKAGWRP